ncbi:hypothetical protein UFOVP1634_16 [uncultured Caudovirales phage]|uniref:Uncharacterized protein n=1 Tax=uncultured Caudovirales phage TaxID=2100421 RepID=A0A6J5SZC8_9CAUD|nr:hypothetical protein UFOVP1030_25 [uncultured Caudovirales phage]CAB4220316.1 hypothetical protein UFOVP1634_16 [uncultured Caudovirales phage]
MRLEVLDYINTLALGGYLLSNDSPWNDNGVPLYIKNLKKIYVDNTEYLSEPLIATLGPVRINQETQSTRIYFANDAKLIPSNYDTLVQDLRAAKDIDLNDGSNRRQADVRISYENDVMVTEIEVRFTKISS